MKTHQHNDHTYFDCFGHFSCQDYLATRIMLPPWLCKTQYSAGCKTVHHTSPAKEKTMRASQTQRPCRAPAASTTRERKLRSLRARSEMHNRFLAEQCGRPWKKEMARDLPSCTRSQVSVTYRWGQVCVARHVSWSCWKGPAPFFTYQRRHPEHARKIWRLIEPPRGLLWISKT